LERTGQWQETKNIFKGRITGGLVGDSIAFARATMARDGLLKSMEGMSNRQLQKAGVVVGAFDRFTRQVAAAGKHFANAACKPILCSEDIAKMILQD
jgi:hypothetical protein